MGSEAVPVFEQSKLYALAVGVQKEMFGSVAGWSSEDFLGVPALLRSDGTYSLKLRGDLWQNVLSPTLPLTASITNIPIREPDASQVKFHPIPSKM